MANRTPPYSGFGRRNTTLSGRLSARPLLLAAALAFSLALAVPGLTRLAAVGTPTRDAPPP